MKKKMEKRFLSPFLLFLDRIKLKETNAVSKIIKNPNEPYTINLERWYHPKTYKINDNMKIKKRLEYINGLI